MRLALMLFGILLLLAALYVGSFHALVAWRGHTQSIIFGSPTSLTRRISRTIVPSDDSIRSRDLLTTCYQPLADLEKNWSITQVDIHDPIMTAVRDALLMHAQVGDAQAAEGMTISALHAFPLGPERNPTPTKVRVWEAVRGELWIRLTDPGSPDSFFYAHDGTRVRRVTE